MARCYSWCAKMGWKSMPFMAAAFRGHVWGRYLLSQSSREVGESGHSCQQPRQMALTVNEAESMFQWAEGRRARVFRGFSSPWKSWQEHHATGTAKRGGCFGNGLTTIHWVYVCMGRTNSSLKMSRHFEQHQVQMASSTINQPTSKTFSLRSMKFQTWYCFMFSWITSPRSCSKQIFQGHECLRQVEGMATCPAHAAQHGGRCGALGE